MADQENNLIERVKIRDFGGSQYALIPKGIRQRFASGDLTGWSLEWHSNPGCDDFTVRIKQASNGDVPKSDPKPDTDSAAENGQQG